MSSDVVINLTGTHGRKIRWTPNVEVTVNKSPPSSKEPSSVKVYIEAKTYQPRNGNGHKKVMTRKMTDTERNSLRTKFLQKNGQFKEDDCVRFKQTYVSDSMNEVGIFQVTGFVSYLHREVACGRIQVHDPKAYLDWMKEKYAGLENFYHNPNVAQVRAQNHRLIEQGKTPNVRIKMEWIKSSNPVVTVSGGSPQFASFKSRKRTI